MEIVLFFLPLVGVLILFWNHIEIRKMNAIHLENNAVIELQIIKQKNSRKNLENINSNLIEEMKFKVTILQLQVEVLSIISQQN